MSPLLAIAIGYPLVALAALAFVCAICRVRDPSGSHQDEQGTADRYPKGLRPVLPTRVIDQFHNDAGAA